MSVHEHIYRQHKNGVLVCVCGFRKPIPCFTLRCEWYKSLFPWTPRNPAGACAFPRTCCIQHAAKLTSWERERKNYRK